MQKIIISCFILSCHLIFCQKTAIKTTDSILETNEIQNSENQNQDTVLKYGLKGRKAITNVFPKYKCNEEGVVVVLIIVDKEGNVIDAKPGVKGTTNLADCLLIEAKKAAMKTKWQPSSTANEKEEGTIKYNFSLKD